MPRAYIPVLQDPKKMRYIEWLSTPPSMRRPATKLDLAKELDVYPKTLYNWENDREFRDIWRDRSDEIIGGEDKRQQVLDTLHRTAVDDHNPRHVAAAKLYLEAIGAMSPQRVDLQVSSKALGMLTDDEIESLIARGLAEQKAEVGDDGE